MRREKPLFFFLERYAQSYRNEWDHFVRVLQGDENAMPDRAKTAAAALLLAEAAYRSLETGQAGDRRRD